MRTPEFLSLAFEIRSFAGIGAKLMSRDLERRIAEHRPGLSGPQYGVLKMLECHPTTIKELSDLLMLTPSTLVPVIDRLESEGLVVRGKDPGDRRRTPLILTDDAHRLLAAIPSVDPADGLFHALESMGVQKSRQLNRLLQELVTTLAGDDQIARQVLSKSPRSAKATPNGTRKE